MSARDLESEIRELRGRIATLVDEAAANEKLRLAPSGARITLMYWPACHASLPPSSTLSRTFITPGARRSIAVTRPR